MAKKKINIVPINQEDYEQIGAVIKKDSKINSKVIEQLSNEDSEFESLVESIDTKNILDGIQNYTFESEQSNSRKSMNNHSFVVEQYNHINDSNIDDNYNISSYEDQINNSQDITFYTQQTKQTQQQKDLLINEQNNNEINTPNYNNVDFNQQTNIYNNNNNNNNYYENQFQNNYQAEQVNNYSQTQDNYNYQSNQFVQPMEQTNYQYQQVNNFQNNEVISQNSSYQAINNNTKYQDGPTPFDKKMKKELRPFNFLLTLMYLFIFGIIGFFGYKLWLQKQEFYLSKNTINLALGHYYEEQITVKEKVDKNTNYTWESDNSSIATVDENGKITGVKAGTANIKVTNKKTKATNTVMVKVIDVVYKKFEIQQTERVVYMGNTFTIKPKVNDQESLTVNYIWTNSNPKIATVTEAGLVTPKTPGRTTITVSVPNTKFKDTITIIVVNKKK